MAKSPWPNAGRQSCWTSGKGAAFQLAPSLEVHVVGDCAQPRTALEAIHDAAALAHRL